MHNVVRIIKFVFGKKIIIITIKRFGKQIHTPNI